MLIYSLITISATRPIPHVAYVEPIVVSLIDRARRLPILIAPVTIKPKLAKLQVTPPQEVPDFNIDVPADQTPSQRATAPVAGSPGPRGSIDQAGGPPTLTVIHYVAPRYPLSALEPGERGHITIGLLVDPSGDVHQVAILRSSGWRRLDAAAVNAVHQWKFAPFKSDAHGEPVRTLARFAFEPAPELLGVPIVVMPFGLAAREIDARLALKRDGDLRAPSAEGSVRRLLQKLITTYANMPVNQDLAAADSWEGELGGFGSIQSVTFMGFADHGIARDKPDASLLKRLLRFAKTSRWEVYDIKQDRGSSVWLVAATPSGSIRRIEVAVR